MRTFTAEEIEFLGQALKDNGTRKVADMYRERYSAPLSQTHLRRVMQEYGLKPGKKQNVAIPVGTEKYSEYYDCIFVKTHHCDTRKIKDKKKRDYLRNLQWEMKQNVVWEKTMGCKLPKGWVVIFLDGNRMNYDQNNLYAVPIHVAGTIEKMKMHSENATIYKTALMWGQLFYEMKKSDQKGIEL